MLHFILSVHAFFLLEGFTQLIISQPQWVWPKPDSSFLSQNMIHLHASKCLLITLLFFQLLVGETLDSTRAFLAQCINQGSTQKQNQEDRYVYREGEGERERDLLWGIGSQLWRLTSPKICRVSLLEFSSHILVLVQRLVGLRHRKSLYVRLSPKVE